MQLIATCILEAGAIAPCCAADSEGLIIGLERMRLQWARVDAIDPSCLTAGPLISPLETLSEVPYKRREYDAEDTVRFCALRLYESGLIKANPKKIIAEKTD